MTPPLLPLELPERRLGYWMTDKKKNKVMSQGLSEAIILQNIKLVKIDPTLDLESQGPFHGILHKLSDLMVQCITGNQEAKKILQNFEKYSRDNPEVLIFDPLDRIQVLFNRFKTNTKIKNCGFEEDLVFIPPFGQLNNNSPEENKRLLKLYNTTFPIVCKPLISEGNRAAHEMTIVFNEFGLSKCHFPCVVQNFVNHNKILYKLYVIDTKTYLVVRPSMKNLNPSKGAEPIHFYSGDVSKPATWDPSNSYLSNDQQNRSIKAPSADLLSIIAETIRKSFGLKLFGVDLVVDDKSGRVAIIDLNLFPGYEGVPSFASDLSKFLRYELDMKRNCVILGE